MLQLKNNSPFKTAISLFPNEKGVDHLYVVIKGTFLLNEKIEVAEEQLPIIMEDEYWAEPEQASLKHASEYHLTKPNTDILVKGDACAPDRLSVTALDVLLQVANRSKIARVFGNRIWDSSLLGITASSPIPFETMPLTYERAYGGFHDVNGDQQKMLVEPRNPVGRGFKGKRSKKEFIGAFLPNIEDPSDLISSPGDHPTPLCFGPIAASWEPRNRYVGTYDEAWQKQQAPYLPNDFDNRFFNTAFPDLICDGFLTGGEPVTIINMCEKGPLQFNLPKCEMDLKIHFNGKIEKPNLNMETVLFDPNQSQFSLTWRASLECDKKALKVEQVDVALKSLNTE